LVGLLAAALAVIARSQRTAARIVRFFRWPDLRYLGLVVRAGLVFLLVPNLVGAALILLGVVELRPGTAPDSLVLDFVAIAALAALVILLARFIGDAVAVVRR